MTNKLIIILLTLFLTMSPLTTKAQYIFDAQDGATENGYPYVYTPKEWHLSALGNGTGLNGMGPMKWNFASPQSDWTFPIASYAQLAIQNWLTPGGQPITPNWISTLQQSDSEVNGIALRIYSTQGPCSGLACVQDESLWVDYGNRAAYTKTINMYIPKNIWNGQQADYQKRILAHEFGHIWGLADRYPPSSGCITTEDSIMEIWGCTSGFTPKSVDLIRLQDFHRASWSYMTHGTAYLSADKKILYSPVTDYGPAAVTSMHQAQWSYSSNGSTGWTVSPYYTFDWYSMGDSRAWGTDTDSKKTVSIDLTLVPSWQVPNNVYVRICSIPILGYKQAWLPPPFTQVPAFEVGTWKCGASIFRS